MAETLEKESAEKGTETQTKEKVYPKNNELKLWVDALDGVGRVSAILGYDPSNIWRFCEGKLETPKVITAYMKLSEKNAELMQEKSTLKRANEALMKEVEKLKAKNKELKNKVGCHG